MAGLTSDLVELTGGEPMVSTTAIAHGVDCPHKSVIRLVRDNLEDLSDFGRVRFQNAPLHTAGGIQPREVAFLNEQQATLLMAYMRNSDLVRKFKKQLVASFFLLRDQFHAPHSFPDALRLLADEYDKREALEAEKQRLSIRLAEQSDKVAFHDAVIASEDLFSVKKTAALLGGMGHYRLMGKLRELTWVDKNNCPYQRKLDEGLMDRKMGYYLHPERGPQYPVTSLITGKGLAKLRQLLADPGQALPQLTGCQHESN